MLCCVLSAFRCSLLLLPNLTNWHFHQLSLSLSRRLSSDPNALGQHGTDHALIGGVVAVVVFVTLCLIIVLGRYLARHKGKIHSGPDLRHSRLMELVEHVVLVPLEYSPFPIPKLHLQV